MEEFVREFVSISNKCSPPNMTDVRYHGSKTAAEAKLPFDAGFETVSVVAAVGPDVKGQCLGLQAEVYI